MSNRRPPVLIVCALPLEARSMLRALHLKPVSSPGNLELYRDGDGRHWLGITGIGRIAAASGTAAALAVILGQAGMPARAVNAGLAAAADPAIPVGRTHRIHRIREPATGFEFFPDLLVDTALPDAGLTTLDRPMQCGDAPGIAAGETPGELFDMEGSGFWQAAARFLAPDSIACLKTVSDHGIPEPAAVDPKAFAPIAEAAAPDWLAFINAFAALPEPPAAAPDPAILAQLETAAGAARLTATQRQTLRKAVQFAILRHPERAAALLRQAGESPPPGGQARERNAWLHALIDELQRPH